MSGTVALDVQVSRALEHLRASLEAQAAQDAERARLQQRTARWFDEQSTYFPRGPLRGAVEVLTADIALALDGQCLADAVLVLTCTTGNNVDRMLSEQARLVLDEVWSQGAPELLARIAVMCATLGLADVARSADARPA